MLFLIVTHDRHDQVIGRHAAVKLEQAQTYAFREMMRNWPEKQVGEGPNFLNMSEQGGKYALPNGTTIAVTPVSWNWIIGIVDDTGFDVQDLYEQGGDSAIVDKYNEYFA